MAKRPRKCQAPAPAPAPHRSWFRAKNGRLTSSGELRWPGLLPELLENISDRLPLHDLFAFRQVCRSWQAAPSGRALITNFSKTDPWLMVYGLGGGRKEISNNFCYLYDASYPKSCSLDLPDLRGATCLESKAGWLLAHRDCCVFFFNPLTFERIDLPDYPKKEMSGRMCVFLSLPTAPDCTVFIFRCVHPSNLEVDSCRVGGSSWSSRLVDAHCVWSAENKWIHICDCRGHLRCDCIRRNLIYIMDKHVSVTYEFSRGMAVANNWEVEVRGSNFCRQMLKTHREDLLLRAGGGREAGLSLCPLMMTTEGSTGLIGTEISVRSHNEEEEEENKKKKKKKKGQPEVLKAVWIEPCLRELRRQR